MGGPTDITIAFGVSSCSCLGSADPSVVSLWI